MLISKKDEKSEGYCWNAEESTHTENIGRRVGISNTLLRERVI